MIVACLCWYDEKPEMLYRCVRSLEGIAERLVALDGAFASYPNGTPNSSREELEAIGYAAFDAGLELHVGKPRVWESQVDKRRALMWLGQEWAENLDDDWLLVIDADERIESVHHGLHSALRRISPHKLVAVVKGEHEARMPRLFRSHPLLTVEGGHNGYRIQYGPWLGTMRYANDGDECGSIANMSSYITILHDRELRSQERKDAAQAERITRRERGEK